MRCDCGSPCVAPSDWGAYRRSPCLLVGETKEGRGRRGALARVAAPQGSHRHRGLGLVWHWTLSQSDRALSRSAMLPAHCLLPQEWPLWRVLFTPNCQMLKSIWRFRLFCKNSISPWDPYSLNNRRHYKVYIFLKHFSFIERLFTNGFIFNIHLAYNSIFWYDIIHNWVSFTVNRTKHKSNNTKLRSLE
jgi:hypothetical protein